jgi:hypothetical protein
MNVADRERVISWAATPDERDERIGHGRRMIGLALTEVRYVNLDYRRFELAASYDGPRQILDEQEWQAPTWRYPGCDSVDHGVELTMTNGRQFTVTWDTSGWIEGIGLREQPLIGSAVTETADVAVWDVGARSRWSQLIGVAVTGVGLHYRPWDYPAGFWCSRISIEFGPIGVELLLGQGNADGSIAPSADNVAVCFDVDTLPAWESYE